MHPYTHIYLSKKIISKLDLLNKKEEELFLFGSILPDLYLLSMSRLNFLLPQTLKITIKFNNKPIIHNEKEILKKTLKSVNKQEQILYKGIKSHLYVDEIAHGVFINENKNIYSKKFSKNHYFLEKALDISLSHNFFKYEEVYEIWNKKNFKIYINSAINNQSFLFNYLNFYIYKIYILYKLKLENTKIKCLEQTNKKVDYDYYISKAIQNLNLKILNF